ncbi:3-beta-hydroxysteroid-Delta(8),Delta(7)-isomerase-like protein [Paramyrothecium foliicola]|nr:3-beta-hydroxysteroid-Delta(8),Delta(7)-isomerase-like protein [Paramyrothecium foliicola]KAI9155815.1 3-beta-hydroxysteroid-Delta(8),Delta(7)-isomerase-like protein [Paramyrothecium foliicola]
MVNATGGAMHPYAPQEMDLPGYAPNTINGPLLVSYFVAGNGAIATIAYIFLSCVNPSLSRNDMLGSLWFTLCYFAYNYNQMPSRVDLFGQMWKEYAVSDSRYLTEDSFVVTMEAITAMFWGPLSILCVYFIVTSHPLRHPLQLIISLGQLYGDVLYYATCTFATLTQGLHYCNPNRFYFWAYYFLCNAFWIVIPFILVIWSVKSTGKAFAKVQVVDNARKR